MLVEIKVPVLPESVTEGTLGAWHKKVGDVVKRDENIVDLETDKVVLEIVATADGVLSEIDIEEGATVTNNQLLGKIDTEASAAAEETAGSPSESNAQQPVKAGPAARKLLKEHGLSGDQVLGSGVKGAITKKDVEQHLKVAASVVPTAESSATVAPAAPASQPAAVSSTATDAEGRHDRRVPMSRLRSRIAERLKEAQNTAALLG